MAKFQSPLLGYNNNVRHNGRVFHIQTEDSGINHPHIITHLFMDGGRILKSIKKSYAEHVGADNMSELVRSLMKEQHKAMFISLRDGQFDHLVEPNAAPKAPKKKDEEAKKDAPVDGKAAPSPPSAPQAVAEAAPKPAPLPIPTPPAIPPPPPAPVIEPFPPPPSAAVAEPMQQPPAQRKRSDQRLELADSDAPAGPSVRELTLDFDALERDSDPGEPSLYQASQLPPPPSNLFKKDAPGTGTYRAIDPEPSPRRASRPPSRPPASSRQTTSQRPPSAMPRPNTRPQARPPQRPATEPRYAPARPAAIFGSRRSSAPPPSSVFGDELVSDKSLDEVILSYLAEDLEPPRRK